MANEISVAVVKRSLRCTVEKELSDGSVSSIECVFSFDGEWDGLTKSAIFQTVPRKDSGEAAKTIPVILEDDRCMMPAEVASSGEYVKISAAGSRDGQVVIPTSFCPVFFHPGCYIGEVVPATDVYLQMLSVFGDGMSKLEATEDAVRQYAEEAENNLPLIRQDAATAETKASEAAESASKAKSAEINAKASETASGQNLSDLLAMLGTDVATLVGGKIPMSQIPATATQEIYVVLSESELTGLTAQRGDLAELVETVEGEQTITKTWQCLGDADKRENWVVWGTSYAVQAGASKLADNATNAGMINNHRLVEMTESEYQTAVKDPNTYYLVG